ncbi:uncharacterized protein V1516DRAFT_121425 [Lipomyces oligophaga]|uniref:uncharacterized protein n=1 Tax=Lipomyces oligophaga TaxID=45792 RepID=UPI0034CE0F80
MTFLRGLRSRAVSDPHQSRSRRRSSVVDPSARATSSAAVVSSAPAVPPLPALSAPQQQQKPSSGRSKSHSLSLSATSPLSSAAHHAPKHAAAPSVHPALDNPLATIVDTQSASSEAENSVVAVPETDQEEAAVAADVAVAAVAADAGLGPSQDSAKADLAVVQRTSALSAQLAHAKAGDSSASNPVAPAVFSPSDAQHSSSLDSSTPPDPPAAPPAYQPQLDLESAWLDQTTLSPSPSSLSPRSQSLSAITTVLPRDEEGCESLPPYTPTLVRAAVLSRKMELISPLESAPVRSWATVIVVLNNTQLNVYKAPLSLGQSSTASTSPGFSTSPSTSFLASTPPAVSFAASAASRVVSHFPWRSNSSSAVPTVTAPISASPVPESSHSGRSASVPSVFPETIDPFSWPPVCNQPLNSVSGQLFRTASGGSSGSVSSSSSTSDFLSPSTSPSSASSAGSAGNSNSHSLVSPATLLGLPEESLHPSRLLRSYTLQYAQIGLANDYKKKSNVIRVRAEGQQFLLLCGDMRECVEWTSALQAACDLALPLDERQLPRYRSIPSRRRRHVLPSARHPSKHSRTRGAAAAAQFIQNALAYAEADVTASTSGGSMTSLSVPRRRSSLMPPPSNAGRESPANLTSVSPLSPSPISSAPAAAPQAEDVDALYDEVDEDDDGELYYRQGSSTSPAMPGEDWPEDENESTSQISTRARATSGASPSSGTSSAKISSSLSAAGSPASAAAISRSQRQRAFSESSTMQIDSLLAATLSEETRPRRGSLMRYANFDEDMGSNRHHHHGVDQKWLPVPPSASAQSKLRYAIRCLYTLPANGSWGDKLLMTKGESFIVRERILVPQH